MVHVMKMGCRGGMRVFLSLFFVFLFNFIGGGGGLFSVREGVREGRFKLGDVEHGVDPSELLREADCNRVHARGAYYLEWSQVLLHQFPRRLGCVEELHFHIYTVANPEGW